MNDPDAASAKLSGRMRAVVEWICLNARRMRQRFAQQRLSRSQTFLAALPPQGTTKTQGGSWWLPAQPDARLRGTVALNERNRVTLHLQGSFGGPREIALRRTTEPVIHGVLDDGTPVTLLDAYYDLVNFLGQPYFANHTFIGAHLTADTLLDEVEFSGTELDNFLQVPAGIYSDPQPLAVSRRATFRGHVLTFELVRSDEQALVDGQPRCRITISRVVNWTIAWDLMTPISLLLTILTGEENALLNVMVTVAGERARVLTPTRAVAHYRAADRRATALIATIDDVPDLDTLLARFDELRLALPHVLGPFVAYLRAPGDIATAAALIANTLESYHRDRRNADGTHRFEQTAVPTGVFLEIRDAFTKLLAAEFSSYTTFTQQLRNDPALRRRLEDLYRDHRELLDEITNEATFCTEGTRNRNRFSHAKSGGLTGADAEAILWAGARMRLLFYAIVLTDLGFTKDVAHALLRRNNQFEMLRLRSTS